MSTVLGIRIDATTFDKALQTADTFLHGSEGKKIFTPNPEMLVKAQTDEYFKKVLNSGDLNLCDGFGLWLATRLSFRAKRSEVEKSSSLTRSLPTVEMTKKVHRIPGVDFMLSLCKLAEQENKKVFLFGSGSDMVITKTAEELKKKFPKLLIAGTHKGFGMSERVDGALEYHQNENEQALAVIKSVAPDIIFVALGMGKQEKWINENLPKLSSVKIAMGVGGSYEYISGVLPRAPLLLRKIGLEWLYRLIKQPQRIGRIWNATVRFLWCVLSNK